MRRPVTHLAVLLDGRHVADLTRTARGKDPRLVYRDDALADGTTPLSLSLPLWDSEHTGVSVERYLRGLVPENEGALAAIAHEHRVDVTDAMDVLSAIGLDCAGAVQFCRAADLALAIERAGALEPFGDADIEARLDQMDTDEDASWSMPGEHWSLGGTQQKFALRREDDAWFLAHGAQPTTHIVKPGVRKMKAQALAEHASMRVGRLLGLAVASTEFRSFKSQEAIVVERFDRVRDGSRVTRRHQEDLCQALGVAEKYEEYGGPSALDVIRLLRDTSETPMAARRNVDRFVDGLVYNTVIGAPDAHARNTAVLLDGDAVTLAPMYDVATGLGHGAPAGGRVLSMSIGGTFLLDAVDDDAWRRFAEAARIDGDGVVERAHEIADLAPPAFAAVLAEVLDEIDDDGTGATLAHRIATAFAERRAAR